MSVAGIQEAALAWYDAGCSVWPPAQDGTKRPMGEWKQFMRSPALREIIDGFYRSGRHDGVGIICGKVSGNLEMLELEGRATGSLALDAIRWEAEARRIEWLWETLLNDGYAEWTPSGGIHFLYRLVDHEAPGNTKIARRMASEEELAENPDAKIKTLSETRGEGGYVIVAPSGGTVHPSGDTWSTFAGKIGTIPQVKWADRCLLIEAIKAALDEMPEMPEFTRPPAPRMAPTGTDRPGDDFAARTDWIDILEPHGWQVHHTTMTEVFWTRPGKDRRDGWSATTGFAGTGLDDRLYVWSSSTEFDTEKPYNKFGAYCVAPETKILMADLTWRDAGKLLPGDEIVGVDEEIERFRGRRKLRVGIVEGAERRVLPCFKVTMEDGRSFVASDGHPWLATSAGGGGNTRWIKTKDLRPGQRICSLTDGTWETATDFDSGWLSGMYDGEGWVNRAVTGLAQNPGPILDRAEALLKERGFSPKKRYSTSGVGRLMIADLWSTLRLLGTLQPGRLVDKQAWVGRGAWTTANPKAVVKSVVSVGDQETAAFSTSTRTFIAEGLVSHNTLLEHNGDFAAAARALGAKGYGTQRSRTPVGLEDSSWATTAGQDVGSMPVPPTAQDAPPVASAPASMTRNMLVANVDRHFVLHGLTKELVTRWDRERLFNFGGVICERDGLTMRQLTKSSLDAITVDTCEVVNRKFDGRRKEGEQERFEPALIEGRILEMILSRPKEFASLNKLSQIPFVRPDGTVCSTPGYDESTKTFLELDSVLTGIDVPTDPSKEEVTRARDLILEDLLGDFPLHTQADKANALATLITPFIRDLIPTSPLAVIDAKEAGSGKNLLADIISILTTGNAAQTLPYTVDNDEQRKVITSAFRSGNAMLLFDEAHEIEGAAFARALTSHSYQDRILGGSNMAEFPNNRTWISLGNQVQIKGDMSRRVYRVRLEYQGSRPESRAAEEFRHPDLRQWAADHRLELVRACLILVRAWFALGKPQAKLPFRMGSFERWQEILAGILFVAGVPDFLSNVVQWRSESDFERQHTVSHLQWLGQQYGTRPFTAAQATDALKRDRSAEHPPGMDDPFPEGYARKLGQWYARQKERSLDGLKLVKLEEQGHGSVGKWMIIRTQEGKEDDQGTG